MPTPETVTFHRCSVCQFQHSSYEAAVLCETLPVPPPPARLGETVRYYVENDLGLRWSYSNTAGRVLAGYVFRGQQRSTGQPLHHWFLVVECLYGSRGAMACEDGRLFASANWENFGVLPDRANALPAMESPAAVPETARTPGASP